MTYIVNAPLVIVRDVTGSFHHVYANAPLPDNAHADDVKRFLDEGVIKEAAEQPSTDDTSTSTRKRTAR